MYFCLRFLNCIILNNWIKLYYKYNIFRKNKINIINFVCIVKIVFIFFFKLSKTEILK